MAKKTTRRIAAARTATTKKTSRKKSPRKKAATKKRGAKRATKKAATRSSRKPSRKKKKTKAATSAGATHGDWAWHELMTSDVPSSEHFYKKLFGWKSRRMPMGEAGVYTIFTHGTKDHAGMMQIDPKTMPGAPSHWMIYVAVDDVDRTVKSATRMGAVVLMPPMEIPDIGRFAMLNDPTGATFAIYHSRR